MAERDMVPLAKWLWSELQRRRQSAREASLAAGLGHAAVSRYLNGQRPGTDICKKLARYFGVPEGFVLELAGHVKPTPEHSRFVSQIAELTDGMTDSEQALVLSLVRSVREQHASRQSPQ
jgi:transcriptional regulator with XRE-family HTH domain